MKEVAAKVVGAMAAEGERIVGDIKRFYNMAKPWLVKAKALVATARAGAKLHPWIGSALMVLEKGLDFAIGFGDSAIAKRLDNAVAWVIAAARKYRDQVLDKEAAAEAEKHKEAVKEAEAHAARSAQHALKVTQFMIDSMLVRSRIDTLMERDTVRDFDHYLRLRAAQKLLVNTESQLQEATTVDAVTADDMFLVTVGSDLLAETPVLSDADAERLDAIVTVRFGKGLIPFVFEELIIGWAADLQTREASGKRLESRVIDNRIKLNRMLRAQKSESLTPEDAAELPALQAQVSEGMSALEAAKTENAEFRIYVQAAEGFLQFMEKDEATLREENFDYLVDSGNEAGQILIDCLQFGKRWEQLGEDQQALVIDFSNIFEAASRKRAEQLVEVEA
ncbi:hypothetical protein CF70_034390 [Cupriavidus sp. SK-3]|nr:hypothetical protein CF70_034390 [Cupriavidus sp. SK-3]